MIRGRIVFVLCPFAALVRSDQYQPQQRTHLVPVGSVTRVADPTHETWPPRLACRKCWRGGASVGTRNGNPNGPSFVADDEPRNLGCRKC